jgi:hypothetical protein
MVEISDVSQVDERLLGYIEQAYIHAHQK